MKTPCCWTIAEIRKVLESLLWNAQAAGGDGPGCENDPRN